MNKRAFLKGTAFSMAALTLPKVTLANSSSNLSNLIPKDIAPISVSQLKARIEKAQALMAQHKIAAIVLEPGAAMDYFAGIQWWRSERLTALVIPAKGDIAIVTPFFEEPSIRETLKVGDDVRLWQEDESPFKQVADIVKDRKVKGAIGFESTVRYFALEGVMSALPGWQHVSADPVTQGCRMIKSVHELQLMHKASAITLAAYQHVWSQLKVGMTQDQVKGVMRKAMADLGGRGGWSMALFNQASAYPHGTKQAQTIHQGSVVLMDSGCSVHGYQSDISRTFVIGEPTAKQRRVWNTVHQGQQVAFAAAKVGTPAGRVDDAVRAYYQTQGFGPDYKLPGLSHRTGHGIGMQGHEPINFVRGEKTLLAKGMCLSNEPGIYLPGEFGVRLEDCIYMGDTRAHWFTEPPESIEKPLGKLAPQPV